MRNLAVVLGGLVVAAGALAVVVGGTEPTAKQTPRLQAAPASFAYLASQRTNRCDLQRGELLSYRNDRRLQGSCCGPMDRRAYVQQLRTLRRYRAVSAIPQNPYDIAAGQARRLLAYQRDIRLTPPQQSTYREAMRLTSEKGPCCCRCWRWDAFQGLSNYLIARRGWSARQVARIVTALDGCGGTDGMSMAMPTG
jgi:hypothetical protein